MKEIKPATAGIPRKDQLTFEVRFVNQEGVTEAWEVEIPARLPEQDGLETYGCTPRTLQTNLALFGYRVKRAWVEPQTDVRIANQAESIGRLMRHLSHHHDELGVNAAEECSWLTKFWAEANEALTKQANERRAG